MDVKALTDERLFADGEVVWSWRAHAGAKFSRRVMLAKMTVANAGSPGRARISRKPLRREGRLSPPVPVVTRARANFFCAGPRVQRPPGLPCALCLWRVMHDARLGRISPRERGLAASAVIARSASDEAIQSRQPGSGLLRFARNDGVRCLKIESEHSPRRPGEGRDPTTGRGFAKVVHRRAHRRFRGTGPGLRRDDGGVCGSLLNDATQGVISAVEQRANYH